MRAQSLGLKRPRMLGEFVMQLPPQPMQLGGDEVCRSDDDSGLRPVFVCVERYRKRALLLRRSNFQHDGQLRRRDVAHESERHMVVFARHAPRPRLQSQELRSRCDLFANFFHGARTLRAIAEELRIVSRVEDT